LSVVWWAEMKVVTRVGEWAVPKAVARAVCSAANSVVARAAWLDCRRAVSKAVSRALNLVDQSAGHWAAKTAVLRALTRAGCSGIYSAVQKDRSTAALMAGPKAVQSARTLVDSRAE
jgi:hypothetical protein